MRPARDPSPDPPPLPGTPLYVHVPFCAAKCHYCDFYSFAALPDDSAGFVEALLTEADARAPRSPTTVFVGGGTPTWLPNRELRALLDGLDARTGFRASAREVTVECNPESLDRAKAELLLELGVTRFSIGFQSLRPELLERFGRVHRVEQAFETFAAVRAAGASEISVDLIYASPGERLATWEADLARVIDLGPQHLSAYNLSFEEGTAFERWRRAGQLAPQPEELELRFFWATRERLASAGYVAYEISNFGLNGYYCDHNRNYWRNGPYVGLGPSAVSKVGHRRTGNPRSHAKWMAALSSGARGWEWEETLTASARLGETWWLGLRTHEGVDPELAREIAGHDGLADPCRLEAERLREQGLLRVEAGCYRLTDRGLPLADAVAARFLRPDSGREGSVADEAGVPSTGSRPGG